MFILVTTVGVGQMVSGVFAIFIVVKANKKAIIVVHGLNNICEWSVITGMVQIMIAVACQALTLTADDQPMQRQYSSSIALFPRCLSKYDIIIAL